MLSRNLKRFAGWGEAFPNRNLYVGGGHKYNARFKDYFSQHQTYGLEGKEHSQTQTAADYKIHRPWHTVNFWFQINIVSQWEFFKYRYLRAMDMATMGILPASCATFYMLSLTAFKPFWVYSVISSLAWYYRVRDKCSHPDVDELEIKDHLYANETVSKYFNDLTSYVIDHGQDYDKFNIEDHPEYSKSTLAKVFNVDANTTTGFFKMCDVESDARMTVHFKTMPWSDQKYMCSHPFLICDLWAEINCKGVYEKVVLIDPKKVNKKIFIIL